MDGWTTGMKNASCHGCWQCGGMIKYFRANQRMRWTLPRTVIRKLLLCSRHATNNISSSLLVHHRGTMTMWWESETRSEIKECWPQAHLIHLIGVQKKKKSPLSCISSSQLWQARKKERYFIFPFFPLDLALDRFSDPLFVSKKDKQPQREEIKDKNGCSFSLPSLHLDLQFYI